jgi:transposase
MTTSITLSEKERQLLHIMIHRGTAKTRVLTRARILLKSAEGWSLKAIADIFEVSEATVSNVRRRYRDEGLERVLTDRAQQNRRHTLDHEQEAILIAVACSPVPAHHDHWTMRLLREKVIELGVVERISPATIHAYLKKTPSNPGGGNPGAFPSAMPHMSRQWKMCSICMLNPMIPNVQWSVPTRSW